MSENLLERWPGYDEQSWQQRFAELDRQYRDFQERAAAKAIAAAIRQLSSSPDEGVAS